MLDQQTSQKLKHYHLNNKHYHQALSNQICGPMFYSSWTKSQIVVFIIFCINELVCNLSNMLCEFCFLFVFDYLIVA